MIDFEYISVIGSVYFLAELIAILFALDVVMSSRSSQGTIAWSFALISIPFITIPLYLLFGRTRFHGYGETMRIKETEIANQLHEWHEQIRAYSAPPISQLSAIESVVNNLTRIPFTQNNELKLLIDAPATYSSMIDAIESANEYVFVQFFIVRDDISSRRLRDALIKKARNGIKVYFLYDEIGCFKTPTEYFEIMQNENIKVSGFKTTKGRNNRFQINFRNHRKLLIIDGEISFIGGLNLGDEYLGFRDTHLRITGPASQHTQLSFLKDWFWATDELPHYNSSIKPATNSNQTAAIINTGPADDNSNCSVFLLTLLNLAQHRLWITSPYFVPDDVVLRTLQAAAIRGVDVRIILPGKADHKIVELASFTYYERMTNCGVRLFRYNDRFMHQKVMLIDNSIASIGTVNLDNRSIYLNFEATALITDPQFTQQVEDMLTIDLENSSEVQPIHFASKPIWFRIAARLAALSSPLL